MQSVTITTYSTFPVSKTLDSSCRMSFTCGL